MVDVNLPHNQFNNKEKEFLDAYHQHIDAIFRHCYFRVHNKELAEDLAQETFIKTWKHISEGKEIKNIKAFLYKVAVNLVIDHSRKKLPITLDDIKEKEASVRLYNNAENGMINHMEAEEIIGMLNELDAKHQQVITMRYINDLPPSEISHILGESPNAVSVRLNYAMKKLREIIKKKYHES